MRNQDKNKELAALLYGAANLQMTLDMYRQLMAVTQNPISSDFAKTAEVFEKKLNKYIEKLNE